MAYQHGWLYIEDAAGGWAELFNHARTSAYLNSSAALGCGTIVNVLDDAGCPAYRWAPTSDEASMIITEGGDPLLTEDGEHFLLTNDPIGWTQLTFSTPALDNAPWYNPAYPESAQALGFWVTEWTGLDSGHVTRGSTPVGSYRGGSVLGPASNSGRTMGFEVLLLAESEAAMEYLFRWLDSTITSVCSGCASDTILIRRYCPDVAVDPDNTVMQGVAELHGVGLLSGSVYGEPPVERAGCHIRQVNFTLEAQDPCMYSPCTEETVDQVMAWNDCFDPPANLGYGRAECRPSCSEMDSGCRTVYNYTIDTVGASAPRVLLEAPAPALISGGTVSGSIPIRIRTYANPLGLNASQICGAPLLAELYVASLPPYTAMMYDMAGRSVKVRGAGESGWVNGFAYVEPNAVGVPRFPSLGCGDYTTIIEPADFCTPREPAMTNPGFETAAYTLAKTGANLFVGGTTTFANDVTVNNMAAFTETGALVPGFNTLGVIGVSLPVWASAVDSIGRIIIGGQFVTARGYTVNRIIRLLSNGGVDSSWDLTGTVGVDNTVGAIAIQADGKIVIGGQFGTARGTTVFRIARLTTTGTLDPTWDLTGTAGVGVGGVSAIAIQGDQQIVIGGAFTTARGVTKNSIARLNTNGTLDAAFNSGGTVGVNSTVYAIAIQPDGKIIIGGQFTTARGTTVNGVARLLADGSLDGTFNIGATPGVSGGGGIVSALALQSDGKVIIAGDFTAARGTTKNNIARLNTDGSLDTTFNIGGTVGVNGPVSALLIDGGDLYVGGTFGLARGAARNRIARLDLADGALDDSYPHLQNFINGVDIPAIEVSLQERLGCA